MMDHLTSVKAKLDCILMLKNTDIFLPENQIKVKIVTDLPNLTNSSQNNAAILNPAITNRVQVKN
jgi:hypothetical protein